MVGLLAVVAVGTRTDRRGRLGDASERAVPEGVFDYALSIGIVVAVLLAILVLTLARRPSLDGRVRGGLSLKTLLLIVLVAALASSAARLYPDNWKPPAPENEELPAPKSDPIRPERGPLERPRDYRFQFRWEVAAIAGVIVLAGLGAYLRSRRRQAVEAGEGAEPELAAELAFALDEALGDLRSERDPRRAVIAAYARMERTLAAHGVPRRPFETPLEYLSRVLRELRVEPAALLALTELFERAKFSRHEIDVAMRDEAISAFESVRAELRSGDSRPADSPLVA